MCYLNRYIEKVAFSVPEVISLLLIDFLRISYVEGVNNGRLLNNKPFRLTFLKYREDGFRQAHHSGWSLGTGLKVDLAHPQFL